MIEERNLKMSLFSKIKELLNQGKFSQDIARELGIEESLVKATMAMPLFKMSMGDFDK